MTFKHTNSLHRCRAITGKMKKADKGHEGQTKARESTMPKFYDFFISTGPFGVLY